MTRKAHYETIEIGDTIYFDSDHPDFGRAEFEFCPVFEGGYMRRLYITSLQQEKKVTRVLRVKEGLDTLQVSDETTAKDSRNWISIWCKEHKTLCQRWYVPSGSNAITITVHFGNIIDLEFSEGEKL